MKDKEYIIFCGGLIVGSSMYQKITDKLNSLKTKLNLLGEIKWEKVTERYLPKYIKIIRQLFIEMTQLNIKTRIMFRQNANVPVGLTKDQTELE